MTERDTSGLEAVQVNQIVGVAIHEAVKWGRRRQLGVDYVPPLFRNSDSELPIVPRIAPPRIEGQRR